MKISLWGVVVGLVGFFLLAMLFDRPDIPALTLDNPDSKTVLATNGEGSLRLCVTSHGDSIGLLVPEQGTPPPETPASQTPLVIAPPPRTLSPRAGFSIATPTDPEYWAYLLGAGWYLDWSLKDGILADGPEHWQMVRVHEDCITPDPEIIRSSAMNNPGQVWIIGNEPDVIWQDNVTPAQYAIFYHGLYSFIKSADPTASIAVGGIAQGTPLRLQYLDLVLQTYQELYHSSLPADWWTVHGYVLREEKGSWGVEIPPGLTATQGELYEVSDHGRLDLFENQITAFRQWMAEHGYQHTPLALTEFGILMPTSYGFPTEMIADYLQQTFTWLDQAKDPAIGDPEDGDRLVQKWAWFSVSFSVYPSSNLADLATNRLTLIGERFQTVVSLLNP